MILVCGEALFDLVSSPQHSASQQLQFRALPGGSPFNLAIGLRRLGESVAFLGGLSEDWFGSELRSRLVKENVDVSRTSASPLPTPIAMALISSDGQPAYQFYVKDCAQLALDLTYLHKAQADGFSALAIGSFLLDDDRVGEALVGGVEAIAREFVVSLDPNIRLGVISNRSSWQARFERLAASATIIKVSDEDIWALNGAASDPIVQARLWHRQGCALVILTAGSRGATILHGLEEILIPAVAVRVVDTVGAGDAFHAAFLSGLSRRGLLSRAKIAGLQTDVLRDIGREAATAAAIVCSRPGADPPTLAELSAHVV
jgi:fructokinase